MYVKICGLTRVEHALVAVDAGAHAIGVVMNRTSVRRLTRDAARDIIDAVRGRADTVLVVNDMSALDAGLIAAELGIDVVQLHGDYTAADVAIARAHVARVWWATSVRDGVVPEVGGRGEDVLLLDAPQPGAGERWDLGILEQAGPEGSWLLAGGLAPDNVGEAIAAVHPWGVDVSSGVEARPGVKDPEKIRAFVAAARAAG